MIKIAEKEKESYSVLLFLFIIVGCIVLGGVACVYDYTTSKKYIEPIPSPIIQQIKIYEKKEIIVEQPKRRYDFTFDDIVLLTQLLDGDYRISGDGEFTISRTNPNYHEIYKVLCVVMNRVRSSKFPNTVREVVLQKGQFVPMPENTKTVPHWKALWIVTRWCYFYEIGDPSIQVVPEDHLFFYGDGRINHTRKEF